MACASRDRSTAIILFSIMFVLGLVVVFCLGALGAPEKRSADSQFTDRVHDSSKSLKIVHTVFRHGPRTPADTYPNDPHLHETFHPYGWGHLTNDGKAVMYETGEFLRHRYADFLGESYVPNEIWAQSTGVSRAQMSLALVLAGLYPPKGTSMQWHPSLNWQPVPIFAEPLEKDSLLLVRTPCPRYYEALEEVFATDELQKVLIENEPLFTELSHHTGMPIRTPDDVQSLYSTLRAEVEYGLQLPEWATKYYPHQLLNLTERSYLYNVHTDELKMFKAGPFVAKLIDEWKHKRNGTIEPSDRKIFAYAGHDSTIVNILAAIGVWEQQLPEYGIMGIFELLEDLETKVWGVQVFLRKIGESEATPLKIPGCDQFCPLDTFVKITNKLISTDITRDCRAKNKDFVTPPPSGP